MKKNIGTLELSVLALILNRRTYLKYKNILKVDFFEASELKIIYKAVVKLHERFKKKRAYVKDIWILIEKKLDEEDHHRFRLLLAKLKGLYLNISPDEEEIINYSILRFSQENMLKHSLAGTVQELQSGQEVDLEDFRLQIDKIIAITKTKVVNDYEYVETHKDRVDITKEPYRLPTGISGELDRSMSGGLAAGELGFFVAPPGRGKTLALVNVGTNALRQGKRVLHITLEINARVVGKRYDSCLCQAAYSEIRENPKDLLSRLKEVRDLGASLTIRDYSYMYCGISEINAILEERYERGKTIDLLIVDYADILTAQQKYKESRFELNRIYEELRVIAGHFAIPVWTASQANRASLSKPSINLQDIAESFGKANTADIVLGLCQTEEEKLEKEMRIVVAKNRLGETNPIVQVVCDLPRMVLRPANDYDIEEHWVKPNLSKIRERVDGNKVSGNRPRDNKNGDSTRKTKRRKKVISNKA